MISGLNRMPAFLVILIVVVVRGRGLPLRSHVAERLPKLGTGEISIRGVLLASAVVLVLLFGVMNEAWAQATYTSLATAIMILSIVVLTGYAGQISLAQWALAGIGALIAGRFVRADLPVELAIVLGILLTIPVGLIFAVPALRTRGVNLAVVTLALGFLVSEVVFANPDYLGGTLDGGTRIGRVKLFGIKVDAFNHPHAWAAVSLICFVLLALLVANLRRSRTGRRLIAVRTNERAAASLGISVFGVKLYAFAVSAALAAVAGILVGFRGQVITYTEFNLFASINSLGNAVIGGLGYVLGAAFGAPNAIGGIGTRVIVDWFHLKNQWDLIIGSLIVFVILIVHQNGIADVAVHGRSVWEQLHLVARRPERAPLPAGRSRAGRGRHAVDRGPDRAIRFRRRRRRRVDGGPPGRSGRPDRAERRGQDDAHRRGDRLRSGQRRIDRARRSPHRRSERDATRAARAAALVPVARAVRGRQRRGEHPRRAATSTPPALSWVTDLFWPGHHDLPPTAVAAVHEFELEPLLDKTPEELPYGRRRLVGIARTVASGPSVVMLDEPAAGLDERESAELAQLIRRLADERNMGVLLVEHDVGLVMSTCDRVVVIDFGSVIASGTPAEIRGDQAVRDAYLGHADEVEEVRT